MISLPGRLVGLFAVLFLCTHVAAFADDMSPLEYVRIYAPADRVAEWPLDGEKYVPVDAGEFERLIELVERGAQGTSVARRCRIESLRGQASYSAGQLRGFVLLQVAHEGAPALLPLEPWGLPITRAVWTGDQQAAALVGTDRENQTAVYVERAGELRLDFALSARLGEDGARAFLLTTPTLAATHWDFEAKADVELSSSTGVATQGSASAGGGQRLHVDAGPGEVVQLNVREPSVLTPTLPAEVTTKTTYVFSTNGVDVVAEWRLEGRLPATPLRIHVEEPLEVVSAQFSGTDVPWRRSESGIEVELPAAGSSGLLRLAAWCPLSAGVPWKLPRVSPASLDWRGGDVDLVIPEPLGLTEILSATGMRQTRAGKLPTPLSGDSLSFACYAAAASLELRMDYLTPRLNVLAGAAVEMGPRETTVRAAYDLEGRDGDQFSLTARVSPGWLIEDIRSVPPERLREFDRSDSNSNVIEARLATALQSREHLQLIVTARRINPREGEAVSLASLAPLHWGRVGTERTLFSLSSSAEQHWRLDPGEGVARRTRQELTAAERELLPAAAEETLVALEDASANANVFVELRPRVFRADVSAEFVVEPDSLDESYTLQCVPEQGAVDVFFARFSHRRDTPLSWSCEAANPVIATAERIDPPPAEANAPETWKVRLWPPQTAPFRILAQRRTSVNGATPLALVEIPGATTHEATARLRARQEVELQIAADGPRPVMLGGSGAADRPPVRQEFLYEPARDVSGTSAAALRVEAKLRASSPPVLVRREELLTSVNSAGEWYVQARFQLEATSASEWSLRLPPAALVIQVLRDGTPISYELQGDVLALEFPKASRSVLELAYSVSPEATTSDSIVVPLPRLPDATHARECRLRLPQDQEIAAISPPWTATRQRTATWRTRLFGPLARSSEESPFLPWRSESWRRLASLTGADGTDYVITGPSDGAPELKFTASDAAMRRMLLAVCLAAAICWRFGRWRTSLFTYAPLAAASVALLCGDALYPYPAGVFVGVLLAVAANAIGTLWPRFTATEDSVSVGSATTRTIVLGAAHSLAGILLFAAAESRAANAPEANAHVYRVLIPATTDGTPTTGRYYVPDRLWMELRRRARALGEDRPEWLLTDARYTWGDDASRRTSAMPLTARWEIVSFGTDVEFVLPWGDVVLQQVRGVKLDGALIAPSVSSARKLKLRLHQPGTHRLELQLEPQVNSNAGTTSTTVALPAHPRAQLVILSEDAAAGAIELNALGPQERDVERGRVSALLGPQTTLTLQRLASQAAARQGAVELEQMIWLHVAPERVTAEVRHQIVAADQPLNEIELSVDSRWSAPGLATSQPGTTRATSSGNRVALGWDVPRTVGERFTFPLRLVTGSGLGELSFPTVEPDGATVRRRWCALTVDPALEMTSLANANGVATSSAPFTAAWGEIATPPQRVFLWSAGAAPPNLQTAFRAARTTAVERLQGTVFADRIDLVLEADLETKDVGVYSLRIAAPRELSVETISVVQESAQQMARWARGEEGAIHVFLNSATLGRYTLQLQGSLPVAGERVTLPVVGVGNADVQTRSVRLARHASAEVDQLTPSPLAPEPSSGVTTSSVRAIGEWALPGSREPITMRVRTNQPRIDAVQLLTLAPAGTAWEAELRCLLNIDGGSADALTFEVDPTWTGPFTLTPAWPHELTSPAGSTKRLLTVRPPQPQRGEVKLSVRGALALNGGGEAAVPNVTPRGVGRLQRFVALPDRAGNQSLAWDLAGFRATPLPRLWDAPPNAASGWHTYEIVLSEATGVARAADNQAKRPQVALADWMIRVEANGSYRGRARWLLNPEGLHQVPLKLPGEAKPLSVKVMGKSIDASADSAGGLLIPLSSDRMPQEIDVLYAGASLSENDPPLAELPRIPIAARQETWLTSDAVRLMDAPPSALELDLALQRLRAHTEVAVSALNNPPAGSANAAAERPVWLRTFLPSLALSRAATFRAIDASEDRAAARAAVLEVEKLDRQLDAACATQPNMAAILGDLPAVTDLAANEIDLQVQLPREKRITRIRTSGDPSPLKVAIVSDAGLAMAMRLAAVAVLAALMAWAGWGGASARWLRGWEQHPAVWLFALGIAWWGLLSPSALGLLIAAFAMTLGARSRTSVAARAAG